MGTKFWEVMNDDHVIGGSGDYCGDNDAHFGRISVFYQEALGDKYDADHLVNHTRGENLGQRPLQKGWAPIVLTPPVLHPAAKNWAKGHYKRAEHQFF
jgi:tubulin beta